MVADDNQIGPQAQDAAEGVWRGVLLAGALLAFSGVWGADPAGDLTTQALAPRSGPRGATMFKVLSPQETGVVTENNYADPVVNKNGYKDPRMWADRYHEFQVGAVGTGV